LFENMSQQNRTKWHDFGEEIWVFLWPKSCPETSVRNYHYKLLNGPEELKSHILRGGSLKSGLWRLFLMEVNSSNHFSIPTVEKRIKVCTSQTPAIPAPKLGLKYFIHSSPTPISSVVRKKLESIHRTLCSLFTDLKLFRLPFKLWKSSFVGAHVASLQQGCYLKINHN
jgi:hypothetical protein